VVRTLPLLQTLFVVACLLGSCARALAQGHHHHDTGDQSNPLGCDPAAGEACFHAVIDDFHAVNSPHPDALGEVHLVLNAARTELRYQVEIDGLHLKPLAADRTAPDDVIGVHLHLNVPDTVGPHVLNIFGLATFNMPAEEDSDLVVDYANQMLTGIYDDGDATIDPTTGQPFFPFYPLTSKPLSDWIDDLENGDLMLAVHTNASGFPTMAIHGHISHALPEPATGLLLVIASIFGSAVARLRSVYRK
jgi:hypothetical protein